MRSAETAKNPAFLVELKAAGFPGTLLEGGVVQDFSTQVYHSRIRLSGSFP